MVAPQLGRGAVVKGNAALGVGGVDRDRQRLEQLSPCDHRAFTSRMLPARPPRSGRYSAAPRAKRVPADKVPAPAAMARKASTQSMRSAATKKIVQCTNPREHLRKSARAWCRGSPTEPPPPVPVCPPPPPSPP